MKIKLQTLLLVGTLALLSHTAEAQYRGGNGDGYTSSRSDDILYEGTTPIVTGDELPDVVHDLTINNPAGVKLSKSIFLTGTLSILNGDLNLNDNTITFGENASFQETPGNVLVGGGRILVTRRLNDLDDGENVANLGLMIQTEVLLGQTTIARGNQAQQLTPVSFSSRRFFDVDPTNDGNPNAFIRFRYDDSELGNMPEADLALFATDDEDDLLQAAGAKNSIRIAAATTWRFLGGTVNLARKTVDKGGVGDFSRLTIGRAFVFLADSMVKIESNKTSAGNIHSNSKITFGEGEPGAHSGNLTAVGDIAIEGDNTITGSVFAGGGLTLADDAHVSGQSQAAAEVSTFILPTFSFIPGKTDVNVPRHGTKNLSPGAYDDLNIGKRGTLFLHAGQYFFEEFDAEEGAVISIDVSAGPVNINVSEDLEFDDHVEIEITPLGQEATNQVNFITLQKNRVDIGEDALILGWIYAPNAEVHFDEECRFKGSVVAKSITVEEEVVFFPHSFTTNLPKPALPAEDAVSSDQSAVISYQLEQNYPNPFNPTTTIRFDLKEAGEVRLSIYNLQGQEVRALITGAMKAGAHTVSWDGKDQHGQSVPSGMYFSKLRVNGFEQTRKMMLTK
ncbi:MAG: FlgD immunoglobulin-like domain containing protein [bacterium]